MKARLIANPQAGGGAVMNVLEEINTRLAARADHLDIVLSTRAGEAGRAAAAAVDAGYDTLFIAGGDGTLNECVNAVARLPDALGAVTFGLLPAGTANDFAHTLGLPEDLLEAVDDLIEGRTEAVDLGQLNDHYFLNVSAGGMIAEASGALGPGLKAVTGKLAYFIGGMQALVQSEARHVELTATGGEGTTAWSQDVVVFAVANGPRAGGGKTVAPEASINDGLLDLLTIEPMPIHELLGMIPQLVGKAPLTDQRIRRRQASEIVIKFDQPMSANADGEAFEFSACHYRLYPGALRIIRGRGPFNAVVES